MANEKSLSLSLTCTKSGNTATLSVAKTQDLTGVGSYSNVHSIGTVTEALGLPADLTTEGVKQIALYNLDTVNYVEVGLDTPVTQIFAKIPAGDFIYLTPYSSNPTYYLKANTAAVNVRVVAFGT